MPKPSRSEAPFLEAIAAASEDRSARLVYADWLDEQGDPRGEWIRLREDMLGHQLSHQRYWDLKDAADAVQRDHPQLVSKSWAESLDYYPADRPMLAKLPRKRALRWRCMALFIEHWFEPLQPASRIVPPVGRTSRRKKLPLGSGYTADELDEAEQTLNFRFPAALREWYQLAGRSKYWSQQDTLLAPQHMIVGGEGRDRMLAFRVENQGCETWGVLSSRADDPMVTEDSPEGQDVAPVSMFAALTLMIESVISAKLGGIFNGTARHYKKLVQPLTRCDLPAHYWCLDPIEFHEGRDLLVMHTPGDGYRYVAARTRAALNRVQEQFPECLE